VADTELRLAIYRRVAAVGPERELAATREELEDRSADPGTGRALSWP
jgi:transcription-repair coupling factor (superfamily II helicase)